MQKRIERNFFSCSVACFTLMKEMASKEESQRLFRVDKVVLPFPLCLKILTFVATKILFGSVIIITQNLKTIKKNIQEARKK